MYGGYYYYDYSWIVLLPAMLFTFITQARITSAYRTYSQVSNSTGITGAEAARRMMDANGLSGIAINILNGANSLTNFYDPKTKSLNLSREVYGSNSIASVCIACHEVGHAIQDAVPPPIPGYSDLAMNAERSDVLRELCVAAALYRLGDPDGSAKRSLDAYLNDPRRVIKVGVALDDAVRNIASWQVVE